MNNKYEQLVEFIINDETDKARELFHQIVVEKSRDIYESLVSEEDLEETMGGNEVEDLVDEVSLDEEGISEEEDEDQGDMDNMDMDSEEDHHADVGGEEELEDRVVDLESALDELKAEFDALMAGEEHEEHEMPGIHGDKDADEMEGMMYQEEQSEFYEAKEEDDEEDEKAEEVDETIVREYVEKVAAPSNKTEGGEVGKGGSANVNKTSTVAGKNDMGGSSANIAKGGAEANPDGTSPKATVKPKGELKGAGSYENVPGAKAGQAYAKKETAVKAEVSGVNKTSPLAK
jgi:hypothetical protein